MADSHILNLIAQIATQEGVDPSLMQADALVESGGRPDAVGDHGTSFGLFQDHVGGAGGRSVNEARRYLDPTTSIRHAAQRFKGARTAEDIYRAQRPADHAGYVARLNQTLRQLGHTPTAQSAPPSYTAPGAPGGIDSKHALLADMLGRDDPVLGALIYKKFSSQGAASTPSASPAPDPQQQQGAGGFPALERTFGLHRSSGDHEAPGVHVQGSYHYQHDAHGHARAYDYGDASNSSDELLKAMAWLRSHAKNVKEAFYDPSGTWIKNGVVHQGVFGGHPDHLHVAY